MGRYYNTSSGREGKFMFGVQSSTDAEYFGLQPCAIQYYASDNDVPKITEELDKLYDELDVPMEARLYYYKEYEDLSDFENKHLYPKCFESVNEEDEEGLKAHKGENRWGSYKGMGWVDFEIKGRAIVLARIRLALTILSDIQDDGYCDLNAEL